MTWPTSTIPVSDFDQPTDSPAVARGYFHSGINALNNMIEAQPGRFALYNTSALDVDAAVTENAWIKIGPTGSGATVIWTALDSVPLNASGIELFCELSGTHAAGGASVGIYAYARRAGSGQSANGSSCLINSNLTLTTSGISSNVASGRGLVAIDSLLSFDFIWNVTGGVTTKVGSLFISAYYR